MEALGFLTPFAFPLGGGTSHTEDVWRALRSAVGTAAGPIDGLEDTWRQCKAIGIAAAHEGIERAAYQALPQSTTDHLEPYERMLALVPATTDTEQDRRTAVSLTWTNSLDGSMRGIELSLQDVSENFALLPYDDDLSENVIHGKWLPPIGNDAVGHTQFPNYSTDYLIRANYTLTGGALVIPVVYRAQAVRVLNDIVPAWCNWQITQEGADGEGFYLDGGSDGASVLDHTRL